MKIPVPMPVKVEIPKYKEIRVEKPIYVKIPIYEHIPIYHHFAVKSQNKIPASDTNDNYNNLKKMENISSNEEDCTELNSELKKFLKSK